MPLSESTMVSSMVSYKQRNWQSLMVACLGLAATAVIVNVRNDVAAPTVTSSRDMKPTTRETAMTETSSTVYLIVGAGGRHGATGNHAARQLLAIIEAAGTERIELDDVAAVVADASALALDAEQPLDDALRLLVASLAEVLVADDPVGVDEVERRPVMVGEGAPDRVVVVAGDGVVDVPILHRLPHQIDVVLAEHGVAIAFALLAALIVAAVSVVLEVIFGTNDDDTYTLRVVQRVAWTPVAVGVQEPGAGAGQAGQAEATAIPTIHHG